MDKDKFNVVTINNIEYIIYPFKYASVKYNGRDVFFLLEGNKLKVKKPQIGEIYIVVPSWVEMQDLYQSSCILNMMTQEYNVNEDLYRDNKIKKLCSKLAYSNGDIMLMTGDACQNLHPTLAQFIMEKVDEVVRLYYMGTGLSGEEGDKLSFDCYKYFRSIYKKGLPGNSVGTKVIIPPVPIPVLLMNICKIFNCTPDIARKISKKDIDMTMIAKEQENICKHPSLIGLGKSR